MAISPPASFSRRKESTSVGRSLPRKVRFKLRSRRLPAIRTFTSPRRPASLCARLANRARPAALTPSTVRSRMITRLKINREGTVTALPVKFYYLLLLQGRFLFLGAGSMRQLQGHLLCARALIISVNDPLHQMMAYHVLFAEEVEGQPLHVLENLNGFHQPAAAGVGKVDLGNVAGDHRFRVESHA